MTTTNTISDLDVQALLNLADNLEHSASSEGCDGGLIVCNEHELNELMDKVREIRRQLKAAADGKPTVKLEYYLLHVDGDVEPTVHGPYASEQERDAKAIDNAMHHREDGHYKVSAAVGSNVQIETFLEEELDADQFSVEILRQIDSGDMAITNEMDISRNRFFAHFMGEEVLITVGHIEALEDRSADQMVVIDVAVGKAIISKGLAVRNFTDDQWQKAVMSGETRQSYYTWANEQASKLPLARDVIED